MRQVPLNKLERSAISVVDFVLDKATNVLMAADEFYDSRAQTRLGEFAKHLAPLYTVNRMSEMGSLTMLGLGLALDVGKISTYVLAVNSLVN